MAKKGGPTVSKDDLTMIKAMHNPPAVVKETLTATAMLLGHTDEQAKDWRFIKTLLGKSGSESLAQKLSSVDVKGIPTDVASKVKDQTKHIEADKVKCVCCACHGLHLWNQNIINTVLAGADTQTTS